MGQEFFCDLCRKSLPAVESLNPVSIGDKKIADVCLTCSSAIGTGISKQIAEAAAAMQAALNQPEVAAPAAPGPEVPPPAPLPPPAADPPALPPK